MKKLNVDLVMGFGGHVSVAYVLAARILGISTAIHEANTQPGLGNRMLKPIVDRIYLGQLACESYFKGPKSKCVGFPVRPALLHGRNHLPDPQEPIRILVLGGSHGADFLNRNTANLIASLQNAGLEIAVIHQAGEAGTEVAKAAYRAIGVSAKVVGYSHDIGELYFQADFAISSAGAGTLAELSIWGLPCLLVPLAAASENHQEANARYFANKTGCLTVTETQWDSETLTDSLKALLTNLQRYESLSLAIKRVAKPDAAAVLANEIQEWLSSEEFIAKAATRPSQH